MKGIRMFATFEDGGATLVLMDGTGVTILPGERYSTERGYEKFNNSTHQWVPVATQKMENRHG